MRSDRRTIIILVVLFLLLTVGAVYFVLLRPNQAPVTPFFVRNPAGQFEQLNTTQSQSPTILDIGSPNQGDNFSLTRVLKGYLHEYDNNTLSIKNEFRGSPVLQLLEVSLGPINKFYCWPETVSAGGSFVQTQSMLFHVEPDGRDIVMPGEREFSLDLLPNMLQADQYLIIQLQDAFNLNATNLVQKLIVLGC